MTTALNSWGWRVATSAAMLAPAESTTDGTRKPYQASPGVLVPGQNNDHSAPVSPGR